jgi:hypothetical protein
VFRGYDVGGTTKGAGTRGDRKSFGCVSLGVEREKRASERGPFTRRAQRTAVLPLFNVMALLSTASLLFVLFLCVPALSLSSKSKPQPLGQVCWGKVEEGGPAKVFSSELPAALNVRLRLPVNDVVLVRQRTPQLSSLPRGSGGGGSGDPGVMVEAQQEKEKAKVSQQQVEEWEEAKKAEGEVALGGERLCVSMVRLFDAVLERRPRIAATVSTSRTESTATGETAVLEAPAELTRVCTCAAASFICRGPTAGAARLARMTRERGGGVDGNVFSRAAAMAQASSRRAMEDACGEPCDIPDVCGGSNSGDTEGACVGPVCDQVCASCVGWAAAAAGTADVPFANLLTACGKGDACLCAQCLESGLLTQAPAPAPEFYGGFGHHVDTAAAIDQLSRFLFVPNAVYVSGPLGPSGNGPGPGHVGPGPVFPIFPYPVVPILVYQPWVVTVYLKTQAFMFAKLCFWKPWLPGCLPPPRIIPIPIPNPGPNNNFPPTPSGGNTRPPPPLLGAPPMPGPIGLMCGDAPGGSDLTCQGIPCEGDATCTTGDPQCCCDVGCVEFGDCCNVGGRLINSYTFQTRLGVRSVHAYIKS